MLWHIPFSVHTACKRFKKRADEAGYFRHGQIIVATSAGQPKRVYAIERVARIRGDPTDDAHSGQWQDPRIQTATESAHIKRTD